MSPTAMSLKVAGWPFLVILVSDATSKVRLPTVNVMAVVSTALTLPLKTEPSCFLGLTGAVCPGAAGGVVPVSCARESMGAAMMAVAKRLRVSLIICFFMWLTISFFGRTRRSRMSAGRGGSKTIHHADNSPRAFGQQFHGVARQILRQQRQGLAFGAGQIRADMDERVAI